MKIDLLLEQNGAHHLDQVTDWAERRLLKGLLVEEGLSQLSSLQNHLIDESGQRLLPSAVGEPLSEKLRVHL